MRYFLLIAFSFLILTVEVSAVTKLEKGKIYSGTLSNVYQSGNVLPLPPGDWRITSLEQNEHSGFGYVYINFKHTKSYSYVHFTVPTTRKFGVIWGGARYSDCPKNTVAKGHKNVLRHQYDYWCASKGASFYNSKAGRDKKFRMNLDLKTPNLSNSEIEHYAKLINDQFIKAYKGKKGANLNFLSAILNKKTNTSSSTSSSNSSSSSSNSTLESSKSIHVNISDFETICDLLGCLEYRDSADKFDYYLKEFLEGGSNYEWPYLAVTKVNIDSSKGAAWAMEKSKRRAIERCGDFTDDECIVIISNGKITNEYFKNKFLSKKTNTSSSDIEAEEEVSTIEQQLKKLKKLLSDGLITQEDYDKKKAEYLENF